MQSLTKRNGYTLMEMLVVIAIIGVLAGLVFPVAATAKARARQAQCMNNMYQIFTALKQFQLDEKKYPEFIGGPVQWKQNGQYTYAPVDTGGVPLNENTGMVGGTNGGNGRAVALYPEYIPDIGPLKCPDTMLNGELLEKQYKPEVVVLVEAGKETVIEDPMYAVLSAFPSGNIPWRGKGIKAVGGADNKGFYLYKYSSYDYQKPPGLSAPPQDPAASDQVHYCPARADYVNTMTFDQQPNVQRQLRWRTPPEDTVVTWCSHHRRVDGQGNPTSGSKDIVLFLDGHTKIVSSVDMEPWATNGWTVPK